MLQLYRYMWQPARYASREWLHLLGFHPPDGWHYGDNPARDRALDQALRARLKPVAITGCLNDRQQRLASLAPRMVTYALGLGLMPLACSDYFMLPDYRQALLKWFTDDEIWRLYGWLGHTSNTRLSVQAMSTTAINIGTLALHRAARHNPVLHALLILLPPPQRALWPKVPQTALMFLESLL
ncbi:type III secretion system domain-containing protein [Kosakonia sp. BYX6]|uniref:Type III secretion system domain-containing protein n=1 Tax=Kosakonia calanthes TaxID=3139408 RepID=A0ABZ3B4L3_9ENTR